MAKRALVVSGGGSRGAFAVGAIEVLREHGVTFDLVTGTSTGALIAPLVATDEIALLHQIYTTVSDPDILIVRRGIDILAGDAIHDTLPLWKLINKHMNDARYAEVLASPVDVFVCATNLQDGKAYFFNPKQGRDGAPLSRDTFCRAIFASSSQPVLMPAVRVPYPGGDQYVDGGVREVAPFSKALEQGATEVYAIVLSPEKNLRHEQAYKSVVDTLFRGLDLLLDEISDDDVAEAVTINEVLKYVATLRQRAAALLPAAEVEALFAANPFMQRLLSRQILKLHIVRPELELPSAGLDFDPAVMKRMLELGRQAAEKLLAAAPA